MPIITRRRLAKAGVALLVAYAVICVCVYLIQDRLVYHPYKEIRATPNDIALGYQEVELETSDGVKISGWYVPARPSRGVVLFFHGNGGNISHRLESIKIFNQMDMDVFIIDYRGFGKSEGVPGEEGTYRDAEAAWEYLVNKRHVPPKEIIIFGRSLGTAVAAEMALRHGEAAGLVIESGFTSVADVGKDRFPYLLPLILVLKHKYDTVNKIDRISMPKLFVHSSRDEIIPYSHGMALYRRAAEPKRFLKIAGGHNDGFLLTGRHYVMGLSKFISECLSRDYPG